MQVLHLIVDSVLLEVPWQDRREGAKASTRNRQVEVDVVLEVWMDRSRTTLLDLCLDRKGTANANDGFVREYRLAVKNSRSRNRIPVTTKADFESGILSAAVEYVERHLAGLKAHALNTFRPEPDLDSDSNLDPDSDPDTDLDSDPDTDLDSDTDTGTDPDSDFEPNSDSSLDSDSEPGSEPDSESESDSRPKSTGRSVPLSPKAREALESGRGHRGQQGYRIPDENDMLESVVQRGASSEQAPHTPGLFPFPYDPFGEEDDDDEDDFDDFVDRTEFDDTST